MSRIVQRGSESLYVQESVQYSKVVLRHNCLKHSRYVTYCLKHKNLPSQFEILQVRQTVTETQQVCRRLSETHIPVLNTGRLLHKLFHVQEIPQKPSEIRVSVVRVRVHMPVWMCACVQVCVCVRMCICVRVFKRERHRQRIREREREFTPNQL